MTGFSGKDAAGGGEHTRVGEELCATQVSGGADILKDVGECDEGLRVGIRAITKLLVNSSQ